MFIKNTNIFTLQDVNWWTGVFCHLWIIVMFLSAVWTLILTLILTAPIHCRGFIGEQIMQWYISPNLFARRNKLIYMLKGLKVSKFHSHFHVCVNYYFKTEESMYLFFSASLSVFMVLLHIISFIVFIDHRFILYSCSCLHVFPYILAHNYILLWLFLSQMSRLHRSIIIDTYRVSCVITVNVKSC